MTQQDVDFIIHAIGFLIVASAGFYGGIMARHIDKRKSQDAEFNQVNLTNVKRQSGQGRTTQASAPPLQQPIGGTP